MLLLIALISIWTAEAFRSATPINIDRCRDHEWIHRDYIVYTCAVDGDVRTIKPFACDPTRGASTHLFLAPLAVNRTKYHDSFIYECKQNETDGSILFHAISCYPGNGVHLMKPGEVAAAKRGGTYFCYKDLDGILRLRYERPIHNHCDNGDPTDIACKMGTAETVYNSEYSHGRPFTIDVSTNVPKDSQKPRKRDKGRAERVSSEGDSEQD
ncbi:unnamed protein product, partial [Mesorhabditis spiculigera]